MNTKRKYPKTTGWYVYKLIFPNTMYYPGISSQQPCDRWQPSHYNTTSARIYIEQFGWENVEHVIVADGLTKEEAEQLENQLIQEGKRDGLCINKNDSGGYCRDNPSAYNCNLYHNNTEYRERQLKYKHDYNQRPEIKERVRDRKRNRYQNDPEYRERVLEQKRQYRLKKKQST